MAAPISVNVTVQVMQFWSARNAVSGNTLLLMNNDIVNTVYVGTVPNGCIIPIGPLGALSVDPTENWYVVGGVVGVSGPLIIAPGGSTWTPAPSLVAASISALGLATQATLAAVQSGVGETVSTLGTPAQTADVTGLTTNGIPLLRGTTQLANATGQTLAANSSLTLLTANITKPSFEAVITLNLPAGSGTTPFGVLQVGWEDQATGLQVGYKQYILSAGNGPANAISYYLSGPCRGNKLVLTLQNFDAAFAMTYSWLFNVISHIYTIDSFIQPAYTGGVIGFNTPGGNPSKGMLFMTQTSIPGNTTITRLTACSNAKCKLLFDNTTANACSVYLSDPGLLYNGGTFGQNIYRINLAAQNTSIQEIQMPNGPVQVSIVNNAAGAVTPGVAITMLEY